MIPNQEVAGSSPAGRANDFNRLRITGDFQFSSSLAHYLQLTDEHFARAVGGNDEAAQNAAQKAHETTGNAPKSKRTDETEHVSISGSCEKHPADSGCFIGSGIPPTGVEPVFPDRESASSPYIYRVISTHCAPFCAPTPLVRSQLLYSIIHRASRHVWDTPAR